MHFTLIIVLLKILTILYYFSTNNCTMKCSVFTSSNYALQKMDINWEEFPLTHPNLFSSILIHCDPGDILSCRIVCTTWRAWFNSSSIWSKLLDRLLDDPCLFERSSELGPLTWYRMRKLLELSREESEGDCLVSCMKIHRALKEPVSIQVSEETMSRVAKLERTIPVIGPPALFIRVKVDHAVVRKIIGEMLCRYLTVIILDKEDTVQEHVKLMIMRSMYGTDGAQNWIYVDNLRPKAKVTEEEDEDAPEGLVLEGEHRLEEALRMSMEPSNRGEKRKNSDDSDTEESDSKKAKLDKDKDDNQEENDMDKSQEDEANTSNKVLYIIDDQVPSSSIFPTILDLLSIDSTLSSLLGSAKPVDGVTTLTFQLVKRSGRPVIIGKVPRPNNPI